MGTGAQYRSAYNAQQASQAKLSDTRLHAPAIHLWLLSRHAFSEPPLRDAAQAHQTLLDRVTSSCCGTGSAFDRVTGHGRKRHDLTLKHGPECRPCATMLSSGSVRSHCCSMTQPNLRTQSSLALNVRHSGLPLLDSDRYPAAQARAILVSKFSW